MSKASDFLEAISGAKTFNAGDAVVIDGKWKGVITPNSANKWYKEENGVNYYRVVYGKDKAYWAGAHRLSKRVTEAISGAKTFDITLFRPGQYTGIGGKKTDRITAASAREAAEKTLSKHLPGKKLDDLKWISDTSDAGHDNWVARAGEHRIKIRTLAQ